MIGMPSCKDVAHLISSDELVVQTWHRRLAVRIHLLMCRHCHNYSAQVRAIGQSVRELYADSGTEARVGELLEILKKK